MSRLKNLMSKKDNGSASKEQDKQTAADKPAKTEPMNLAQEIDARIKDAKDTAEDIKQKLAQRRSGKKEKMEAAAEDFRLKVMHTLEVSVEFQYSGKAVSLTDITDRIKEICVDDKADVYVKPEENRVYFVSGDVAGSFEI